MRVVSALLAIAAGLALADASVVTLALPELLEELDTTVEGVAAVIGVYTVVLALVLVPAERLARRLGPGRVAAAGFAVFAAASLACALADTLSVLLVARGIQAVGGGAGLVAVFSLLHAERAAPARRLWLAVAVLGAAVGPALGGALTQAFDWRAIFLAQVPLTLAAALAALAARRLAARERARAVAAGAAPGEGSVAHWQTAPARFDWAAGIALALVSAALTAVLFLLVLLLIVGWNVDPLRAALAVTVLPLSALVGSLVPGAPRLLAAVGCLLVGLGTAALAYLPLADLAWTVAPQVLAGLGMGMALPALGGELLPERDARDAARLLTVRHVGIAAALVVLAPIVSDRLDAADRDGREKIVALVLVVAGVGVLLTQMALHEDRRPPEVALRDPCEDRPLPRTGGIAGFVQDQALQVLDRQACTYGSSREALVLALTDEGEARRYEREYGEDPRALGRLLGGLLG
jgi:MFS family permease